MLVAESRRTMDVAGDWSSYCRLIEALGWSWIVSDARGSIVGTKRGTARVDVSSAVSKDAHPTKMDAVLSGITEERLRGSRLVEIGNSRAAVLLEVTEMLPGVEDRRLFVVKEMLPASRLQESNKLSRRQRDIARLLVTTGDDYAGIAERIGIQISTLRTHVERIYRRMGVHSRAELVAKLVLPPSLRNP